MAVKVNEKDEAFLAEFLSDVPLKKKKEEQKEAVVESRQDDSPRSYNVKIGTEGNFRVSLRRYRNGNLMEDIKKSWANAIERSKNNGLKKMDALGFALDKISDDKQIDFVLE